MGPEDKALLEDLEAQRALLIAVATGGPRIQEKNPEYVQRRGRIKVALEERGIADPIPFADLWSWYGKWSSGDLPRYQSRRDFITNLFQPLMDSIITATVAPTLTSSHSVARQEPPVVPKLKIFISHSCKDAALVQTLVDLLRAALNLPAESVRCTSVDGYRLSIGSNTNERLRIEVREAEALIGILTPHSLKSAYVLFELGARWGAGLFLAPVLASGADTAMLGGPLSGINALHLTSRAEIHQMIGDLGEVLGIRSESPAAFERQLAAVLNAAATTTNLPEEEGSPSLNPLAETPNRSAPVSEAGKELLALVQSESDLSARGIVQILQEIQPGITHFFPRLQYSGQPMSIKSRLFREGVGELLALGYFHQPEENDSTNTLTFEYRSLD